MPKHRRGFLTKCKTKFAKCRPKLDSRTNSKSYLRFFTAQNRFQMHIFQVDAFASALFKGNPAAVIPLENSWPTDQILQSVAAENNLSETAFFMPTGDHYALRWFTPNMEVRLCGHATLASAHVLFKELNVQEDTIHFETLSGRLTVHQTDQGYQMDFPADVPKSVLPPAALQEALSGRMDACYKGLDDYMVLLSSEQEVAQIQPNLEAVAKLDGRGLIITAPGDSTDFVSRCFYPRYAVPEDPVTGSAHTVLTPYWAAKLGKTTLSARQISKRSGDLICAIKDNRVLLTGQAVTYLSGQIFL